jgi:hypothetical protein
MGHPRLLVLAAVLGWASSAAAVDADWYRSSCGQTVSANALGPCLRGGGVVSLRRRLAMLKQVRARLAGPERKELLDGVMWGALAEEPKLRRAIGEVLVDAKLLSPAAAERIPAASEVMRVACKLVAESAQSELKPEQLKRLSPSAFRLAGESAPGTIEINASGRIGCDSCYTLRAHLTLTRGAAGWKLERATRGERDDGACGCCIHGF